MRTEPDIFTVVTYRSKRTRIYMRTTKHYYVVEGVLYANEDLMKVLQKTYYRTTVYRRALQEIARLELRSQNWMKTYNDPNGKDDRDSDGGSPS